MNRAILTFLVGFSLLGAHSAHASKTFLKTALTCLQLNGDQWVEAGIIPETPYTARVVIVKHDASKETATLVADISAAFGKTDDKTVYYNREGDLELTVFAGQANRANLVYQPDTRNPIAASGLTCQKN